MQKALRICTCRGIEMCVEKYTHYSTHAHRIARLTQYSDSTRDYHSAVQLMSNIIEERLGEYARTLVLVKRSNALISYREIVPFQMLTLTATSELLEKSMNLEAAEGKGFREALLKWLAKLNNRQLCECLIQLLPRLEEVVMDGKSFEPNPRETVLQLLDQIIVNVLHLLVLSYLT
ncbi:hypothetical protein M501DRAFT_406064 [Patellaria atrata CBS 101060]|uniref:Uncharacterized protein n=1 Tax=Patellaria atrata CBS 101060 TaxID=1346257 RepID=A0A9P4SG53_9PEZI|nr:hypothetical protein M501DRAFT_406064 [Patellaria atrata CBS 101060]